MLKSKFSKGYKKRGKGKFNTKEDIQKWEKEAHNAIYDENGQLREDWVKRLYAFNYQDDWE